MNGYVLYAIVGVAVLGLVIDSDTRSDWSKVDTWLTAFSVVVLWPLALLGTMFGD